MTVTGTKQELDWLFAALEAAGFCCGCPARAHCRQTDAEEDAAGIVPYKRKRCKDVLRDVIQVREADAEEGEKFTC